MTLLEQLKVILGLISVNLLIGAHGKTVYMDKYGDCITDEFALDDSLYTILPKGGGIRHERLICQMTFKARKGHGVCITFQRFSIKDCGVKLKIFDNNHGSGRSWNSLGCDDDSPKQMCTAERYVTVILQKKALNGNKHYSFNVEVKENRGGSGVEDPDYIAGESLDRGGSDHVDVEDPDYTVGEVIIDEKFTGEDVFFASLGIFVAIIAGVIVLIIAIAVLIICCCCKGQRRQQGQRYETTSTNPPPPAQPSDDYCPPEEPSAPPPPAPTDYFSNNQATVPPSMYPPLPQYHHTEAPPPYTPTAPGYSQQGYAPQSAYTGDPETKQPMV